MELRERRRDGLLVARRAMRLRRSIWPASAAGSTARKPPSAPAASGEGALSVKQLTPTTFCSPAAIAARRAAFERDQTLLDVARLDRGERAARALDPGELGARIGLQLLDLGLDHRRAVEQIVVVEQVGLVGQDLLHAQAPLLVPGPRQAERLVPGRQLHGAGAGGLGQHDRQHLEQDAIDVVLRLLLGEARAS